MSMRRFDQMRRLGVVGKTSQNGVLLAGEIGEVLSRQCVSKTAMPKQSRWRDETRSRATAFI